MGKFLKWLGYAAFGIGSMLMFMASTPKEEAVSNIASYFGRVGLERLAAFLNNAATDQWGFLIGVILLSVSIIGLAIFRYKERKSPQKPEQSDASGQPRERPQSIGFVARGGTIKDSVSEGYDVGFDTENTDQSGNQAVAANTPFPPPTGEFANLTNEELRNEMIKLADQLASLGGGLENIDKIKETLPRALSLTSEALERVDKIPRPSDDPGMLSGAMTVRREKVVGAFPALATSRFLRHIAEHLK